MLLPYAVALDLQALSFAVCFSSGATVTALAGQSVSALAAWERALCVVNVLTAQLLLSALAYSVWRAVRLA